MSVGKRSLVCGVHQLIWHPLTVLFAWCRLYGFPNWKELICIIIHDWGYYHTPNIEGEEGERHPEFAAKIARKWLGMKYHDLCLYHSRHYAGKCGVQPSRLCWADKLSILYEPWWFYLTRAWLSGELKEYRQKTATEGFVPLTATHREWFEWVKSSMVNQSLKQSRIFRAEIII